MESMTETSRTIEPDTLDRAVYLEHGCTAAAWKEVDFQQEMWTQTPDTDDKSSNEARSMNYVTKRQLSWCFPQQSV